MAVTRLLCDAPLLLVAYVSCLSHDKMVICVYGVAQEQVDSWLLPDKDAATAIWEKEDARPSAGVVMTATFYQLIHSGSSLVVDVLCFNKHCRVGNKFSALFFCNIIVFCTNRWMLLCGQWSMLYVVHDKDQASVPR
jgi:hypothetical protein